MSKGSAPPAPDYTPIAAADQAAAQQQFQLGQEQLDWGKQQFNTEWPFAQQYLQQQTTSSAAETKSAQDQQSFYDSTYKPIETQFAGQAANYNSPDQAAQNAGGAMADVASTFDANRTAALSNLESYGIDPSQTRYGALDLSTRISQAAATAGAGTQSRLNTQATGMGLEGEAINIGRGYPGAVSQAYSTAAGAGSSGINIANSTVATGANSMGSPTSYYANGVNADNGATGALNTGFSNSLAGAQFTQQGAANTSSGIGSLVGGAIGVAGMAAIAI